MKNLYAPKGIIPVPPTPFAKNDTINEAEYDRSRSRCHTECYCKHHFCD